MGETTADMASSIIAGHVQIAAGTVLVSKASSLSCWRGAATCKREGHIARNYSRKTLVLVQGRRRSRLQVSLPPSSLLNPSRVAETEASLEL